MESWLKPMLCSPADVVPTGDEWVMERKVDGWRAIAHVTPTGRVKLYGGRNGSEYTGRLPYIEGVVSRLPADTVLDGELTSPDDWGSVQGVMTRTSGGPHEPTVESPPLVYVLFDVLRIDGNDVRALPWADRRQLLEAAKFRGPLVKTSQAVPADQRTHLTWVGEGFEGSVCKRVDSRYTPGRSPAWVKIKPQETCEATIVGFKPGKKGGQWDGKVGAFEVRLVPAEATPGEPDYLVTGMRRVVPVTTTVKCGTDATHESATNHPEQWLGKVIEIAHHGIGKTGVPRHPQFLRVREDRTPPKPPRLPRERVLPGSKPWMRNYQQMSRPKLWGCINELENGYGDAYDRVIDRGGDVQEHIRRARAAL